jgi:DNA-binding response OmpR family regulator
MESTHATILLVEDDAAIRRVMRIFLEDLGCDVIEAQDGHEGFLCYQALPIDAVISDIHMPKMDGLEMIKAIRHYDPAVLMIAMSSDTERLSLAHGAGAQHLLKKPFDLDELHNVLDAVRIT